VGRDDDRARTTDVKPLALWIVCLVLGAGDALLFGIGGVIFGGLMFVLALLLAIRGDPASALSGLLLGFGAMWLALMAQQSATGGQLDDPAPWLALGIVPSALGFVLALARIAGHRRTVVRG
jgi:4-hydroxybenzoate polyprenyltransferase